MHGPSWQGVDPAYGGRTASAGPARRNLGRGAGHLPLVHDAQEPDAALWGDLLRGETQALAGLFDRYSRQVYNFSFRRTASWVLAEEVTQATFVSLWRRRSSAPTGLDTGRGWLFGIAENECRNAVRGAVRADRLRTRLRDLSENGHVDDPADVVSDRLDAERRMAELRAVLDRLPAHEQRTIELVVWSGLSMAEAATAMGVAEGTVKSRLFRARGRLTQLLDAPVAGGRA
jgi:RNA polymerase sigma-70 factor (ECF subfamily)